MLHSHLDHITNRSKVLNVEQNDVAVQLLNTSKAITLIGSMILDVQASFKTSMFLTRKYKIHRYRLISVGCRSDFLFLGVLLLFRRPLA